MQRLANITPAGGHAVVAELPSSMQEGSDAIDPGYMEFAVFEEGQSLGPRTDMHDEIRGKGAGRYSVWGKHVYFSSTDQSDPTSNGKRYEVAYVEPPLIEKAIGHLKFGLSGERVGLVREALRNVLRCGGLEALSEVSGLMSVEGRDVLEVGAGACWVAPFFLAAGARSYHGVDIGDARSERRIFNRRFADQLWTEDHYVPMPLSLGEFLDSFRNVTYEVQDFTRTSYKDESFDVVFLRVVSEHLLKFRGSFREINRLLRRGGELYLSHGSYQSWNGHHVTPHTVAEIDPARSEQAVAVDWAHLRHLIDNDRSDHHNLNYVRLHELFDVLQLYFRIKAWWYTPSDESRGGGRLTDAIRNSLPGFYREEMETEMAYVLAEKSGVQNSFADFDPQNGPEVEMAYLEQALRPRVAAIAKWLKDGGDILQLSRATGISSADLGEIREQFIESRSEQPKKD